MDYFQLLSEHLHRPAIRRSRNEGGAGASLSSKGPIRMKQPNHILGADVVLYFTGVLQSGVFVRDRDLIRQSLQLRAAAEFKDEIWCCPSGFDSSLSALEDLFRVDGNSSYAEAYESTMTVL